MPSAATGDPPRPVTDRPRLSATADPDVLAARLDAAQDTAPIRKRLAMRAASLPDGHPSSPRDEDGGPRRPEPSLADVEILTPPLTDAQWADHVCDVAHRLDKAVRAGLTTDRLYTTDPDRRVWSPERNQLHAQILDEVYARATDVPCEHSAVLAGGLGGAGKTTVLDGHAGVDRSQYLIINPDEFKEELAKRDMLPRVPGLSPMEESALAHQESSALARRLAARALADGKNVIWDITMSSEDTVTARINDLLDAGYEQVDGIFVDIPIEVSVARADARHRHGHNLYLADTGIGGRYLFAYLIRAQADPDFGSVNRRVFEAVKSRFGRWSVYDNSKDGRAPILIDSSEMINPNQPVRTDGHG